MNMKGISTTPLAYKCYYEMNHYAILYYSINQGAINIDCPWYSNIETWEHVVLYLNTRSFQPEFITNKYKELKKNQPK